MGNEPSRYADAVKKLSLKTTLMEKITALVKMRQKTLKEIIPIEFQ